MICQFSLDKTLTNTHADVMLIAMLTIQRTQVFSFILSITSSRPFLKTDSTCLPRRGASLPG
ncbi:MAG: hypothetical protein ABI947_24335 [Chloroflexota bacterium]